MTFQQYWARLLCSLFVICSTSIECFKFPYEHGSFEEREIPFVNVRKVVFYGVLDMILVRN